MDMMYSRYSNPKDLMKQYIEQGEFGELVSNIVRMDEERKQKEAEKEDDSRLWSIYIRSLANVSFNDWKEQLVNDSQQQATHTNKGQLVEAMNNSQNILSGFIPED